MHVARLTGQLGVGGDGGDAGPGEAVDGRDALVLGAEIVVLDAVPPPFGLARHGVSPLHPEVKNCIAQFQESMEQDVNPRGIRYRGNVRVGGSGDDGVHVSLDELLERFDAVVLAVGAAQDNVPSRALVDLVDGNGDVCPARAAADGGSGIISARRLVEFYNGQPGADVPDPLRPFADGRQAEPLRDVVIVGNGNVALDVAQLLTSPRDVLAATDTTAAAVDLLPRVLARDATIRVLGRRGLLEASFTIKELRELVRGGAGGDVRVRVAGGGLDLSDEERAFLKGARAKRRIVELLEKASGGDAEHEGRHVELHFARAPLAMRAADDGSGRVASVETSIVSLEGEPGARRAVTTDETESFPADLVVLSVGYRTPPIGTGVPYDEKRGVVPTEGGKGGRVVGGGGRLFATGWCATGPQGVILSTMMGAKGVAELLVHDVRNMGVGERDGLAALDDLLAARGVAVVNEADWMAIDEEEVLRGAGTKPREKIVDVDEAVAVAKKHR